MYIESWNYVDCLWSFICIYIEKSTVVRIILASDAYCLYIYPLSEIFKFLCCVPCKRDEWVTSTKSHILYHYDIQNIAFIALLYIKSISHISFIFNNSRAFFRIYYRQKHFHFSIWINFKSFYHVYSLLILIYYLFISMSGILFGSNFSFAVKSLSICLSLDILTELCL